MKAKKVHSSQILAMILSLVLAAGSLMMPVFGEQTSKNAEEPVAVEADDASEDEVAEAVVQENFEDESETEEESEEEYTEDDTQSYTETNSLGLSIEDAEADTAVEEDIEEKNDCQNTLDQSLEEVSVEPAQGSFSTEVKNAVSNDLGPVSIEYAEVTGITDKTYDGSAQTQTLVVKYGDETLVEDRDYEVAYYNNIDVGTATVIISGVGSYTGTIEATFSIERVGWYQEYGSWYYADENGNDVTGWKLINGKWYYFDSYMYSGGEYYIDNAYYRFSDSGAMITGWYQEPYGDWYYYLPSGKQASGWQLINGKWYYFDSYMYSGGEYYIDGFEYRFSDSGAMYTGWYKDSYGEWYYYLPSGKQASGWQLINGKWYYFDSYMYSGDEYYIGNAYYRFSDSGAMFTGWYKSEYGGWYYYLPSGKRATGWQLIGGKWYYFDYAMLYDCVEIIGGKGYKFAKSGYMMYANTTGWVKTLDGNGNAAYWYYVNKGGALAVGWQKIGGKWYYFDTYDCEMYCDWWALTIGNKGYVFGSSGAMLGEAGGWVKGRYDYKYYANKGGSLVKGWKKIKGKWYYFDANGGYYMYRNGTYKISQKSYKFDKNGVCKNK